MAARDPQRRGVVRDPTVVGAVLQLGQCYDLTDTQFTRDLAEGYRVYLEICRAKALAVPKNTPRLHRLDCAVLNWWLSFLEHTRGLRYDSVRCAFVEGAPIHPDARIHHETHLQVAIRNPGCILGVFRPTATPSTPRTP